MKRFRRLVRTPASPTLLLLVLVACMQGGGPQPNPNPTSDLSIGAPLDGQTLAGTVIAVAGGVGGSATDLEFTLGTITVEADSDGTAILNTSTLDDGEYTLEATARVDGQQVGDSITVTVRNDLPSSGTVGPEGGTLKSGEGSYATLPPGALDRDTTLTLEDTTQGQILDGFGVDYPALGVTFLGSLTVDATGASSDRSNTPVGVDLAGWAQAVQPGQDVVMFNVLPDADGDGIGELTFAAAARATPDGSVVTVPSTRAAVYGLGEGGGSLRLQQSASVRPGEIVTLQGRGLNPQGVLGNTARFGSGEEILVIPGNLEAGRVDPLQAIVMAVPALGGARQLTLRNGTTGFESEPLTLQIGSLGSGTQASWDAFLEQLAAALGGLTGDDPELAAVADELLAGLNGDATLRAMVASSGLVDTGNLALLEGIVAGALSVAQRELVVHHALLLDALAVSSPAAASSGADLAGLLLLTSSAVLADTAGDIRRQQAGGGGCSAPSAPVFWGTPTGMGSAPPSSCAGGSGGGAGGGGSPLRGQRLGGSVGPVSGAVVRALAPGTADKISPFTAVTDEAGFYYLPFLPPNEPVTIQAIDIASGRVAELNTVTGSNRQAITVPLVFVEAGGGQGSPTASFTATPDPSGPFGRFLFDASASSDPDGNIVEYFWVFGDGTDSDDDDPLKDHTYVTAGTFTVRLTVVDDEGKVGSTAVTLPELPKVSDVTIATGDETGRAALPSLHVPPGLSANGRHVVFLANGSDLSESGAFSGDRMMLYRSDLQSGIVEIVSIDGGGDPANPLEYFDEASGLGVGGDAELIAFASQDALVPADGDTEPDIYLRDMTTGEVRLIAVAPGGEDPAEPAWSPSLSDDGTLLAAVIGRVGTTADTSFITVTDLVSGDVTQITAGSPVRPVAPILSGDGAYLVYQSHDSSVGTLTRVALDTLASERVTEMADGTPLDADVTGIGTFGVSSDGRYVTFKSGTNAACASPWQCLLRKDMDTGEITVVAESASDASFIVERASAISGNGRWVIFVAEVKADPTKSSIRRGFVWDAETGEYEPFDLNQLGAEPDGDVRTRINIARGGAYIAFQGDARNYIPTIAEFTLAPLYRTDNPAWEAP